MRKSEERARLAKQWDRAYVYINDDGYTNTRFIKDMSEREIIFWFTAYHEYHLRVRFRRPQDDNYIPRDTQFNFFLRKHRPELYRLCKVLCGAR